jgi:hypothetical protein
VGKALTFDEIKEIGIIAIFSDDRLMDELVLKGGNAIDIAYARLPAEQVPQSVAAKARERRQSTEKPNRHCLVPERELTANACCLGLPNRR